MDYQLIVPYIPNLRRYARALVGDRDGADDLVQDTLERAVRKSHLWRPGDLRAWLFSIMHNVFVNQLKARRIMPDVEVDDTFPAPSSPVTSMAPAAPADTTTTSARPAATIARAAPSMAMVVRTGVPDSVDSSRYLHRS